MNEVLKTIHSLRSIHGNFSSREIRDEDIRVILDACVRAANASARQSYSIVVVKDRELMKKLSGFEGSRTFIFCVDFNRIIDTAGYLNYSFSADGVVPFVTGAIDTILVAETAAIAAKSLGIDSLFTNGIHREDITRVYELLGLPEKYCFPMIALVLGYLDQEPVYLKGRLSGPGVIHYDRYHKVTTEEMDKLVMQYDDSQKHLGLIDDWKQQGFKHYLDWFYTVWSAGGGKPSGKSRMAEILEKIGFMEK